MKWLRFSGKPRAASLSGPVPEGAASLKQRVEALIRQGDAFRDRQSAAEAARRYAAALDLVPDNTDIRVQFGNMLKDAGRYPDAEAAYRQAILERPEDADIHLQLGHVLKLQGRRQAALAEYQRALEFNPSSAQAVLELASAGVPDQQMQAYEAQLRSGGAESTMIMVGEILDLQHRLDKMLAVLPSVQAWTAFPLALYRRFREVFDVGAPPPGPDLGGFTVVLLADAEPLEVLYAQLSSLRGQGYADWRLLALGADPTRRQVVERAAAADLRFSWVPWDEIDTPAAAEWRLVLGCNTAWCLLLARNAVLHRHALGWIAVAANMGGAAAFVCDEEVGYLTHKGAVLRSAPSLRQVVDYDTLLEANVFGETIAIRRSAWRDEGPVVVTASIAAARSAVLLHFAKGGQVGHIPLPLVWRLAGSAETTSTEGHLEAVTAHLAISGSCARVALQLGARAPAYVPIAWQSDNARLGVIIPTRDNADDVVSFVDSLRRTAACPDAVEILVVDNAGRASTHEVLEQLAASGRIRLLTIREPFNWSRLNNQAVQQLDTPLIVFANDDMQMLTPGWDDRLRGLLARPDIGAVGARLLYPDDTIQHAGILFGWTNSPTHHDGLFEPAAEGGPAGRWHLTRAVSAVTGAFLATRRDLFIAQGGFDAAELAVSYSDIDFALKLRMAGLKILWTPGITLYHHESKTRGMDYMESNKAARNAAEEKVMHIRWGSALEQDPSLNPVWYNATLPFRLLAPPSEAAIKRHIQTCAAPQPWLVSMERPQ